MGETTRKLSDVLSTVRTEKNLEKFLEQETVSENYKSFLDYFRSLPQVKALSDRELIDRSGIERSYYYQIMNGRRTPGRDKLLRLAIGAGLSVDETNRMLELAGHAPLYPKNRRDIILSVALNQSASVTDADLLLYKYEEKPLE